MNLIGSSATNYSLVRSRGPVTVCIHNPPSLPPCLFSGPRRKVVFRPEEVKAAIVTCGGLCPGLVSLSLKRLPVA